MQNASMHDGNESRNSDFPEAFSSCDTRSVAKFQRRYLLPPFHFDVYNAQKAATAANYLQFFSVPQQSSHWYLLPKALGRSNLQLAILTAKLSENPRPRRERALAVENLSCIPRPPNRAVLFFQWRCGACQGVILP